MNIKGKTAILQTKARTRRLRAKLGRGYLTRSLFFFEGGYEGSSARANTAV